MKVSSIILLLSTLTSSAFALTIPIEARDLVERTHPKGNKVTQNANSNNWVENNNEGGYASNGDTTAYSGGRKGAAVAIPIAIAGGSTQDTTFDKASNKNTNKSGGNKVKQNANSGNTVINSNSGGTAINGDTKALSGHGTAIAVPVAIAGGSHSDTTFSDASNTNTNEKRNGREQHPKGNKVTQNANSNNDVYNHNSGGYASNGDTKSEGYLVGVAVPVAIAGGSTSDTTFDKARNSNTNKSGGNKTKQNANSGNTVSNSNTGGDAENGDTTAKGGLVAVAVPVAVAGGSQQNTKFSDASNDNTND